MKKLLKLIRHPFYSIYIIAKKYEGFIGSAVIRHIIDNTNHSVVNVDKLTYTGNLESLVLVENDLRYAFEQVDICNTKEI
jgi:dTDP-glucose 4,6-dehydratase